jgi:hypothetical protein
MATQTAPSYPFVYYSSLVQDFAMRKTDGTKSAHYDRHGRTYTREQFDSITPLLSYRQLTLINALPDTILGIAVDPHLLRTKTVMWRYSPRDIHAPQLPLYLMYESMSGRANLESPPDVFRLRNSIEFVDKQTNTVNESKSLLFRQKMDKEHFAFPAQQVWGNLSIRKPYDEGYFVLDSRHQLYHIKQVNARPYVRNTLAGDSLDIACFKILEVPDRSIYGFILTRGGSIYTLNEAYTLTRLDLPPIDLAAHSLMLMGNMLYWTINVQTPDPSTYHVLDAATLQRHDTPHVEKAPLNRWSQLARWLFPLHLTLESKHSAYLTPQLHADLGLPLLLWGLLGAGLMFFLRGKKQSNLAPALLTLFFGIAGLTAALLTSD